MLGDTSILPTAEADSVIDNIPVSRQANHEDFLVKCQDNVSTRAWIHLPHNAHGHGQWAVESGRRADSYRKPLEGYC